MVGYDEQSILRKLVTTNTRQEAFSDIVKQYCEPLYWKIRRIVLTHEDADDILQNTFIKAWNNISEFRQQSKLSTWLYRIAINESLDFVRKNKNISSISVDEGISFSSQLLSDTYFDGDYTQALLQEAIATLPDVQRVVFNLHYFDEMKYSEISKILATSEGALKASYHLAVKKITDFLEKEIKLHQCFTVK